MTNGQGNVTVSNLIAGKYTATAIFKKTDILKGVNVSAEFRVIAKVVSPVDPNLKVTIANIIVGSKATIRIATNAAFTGKVTVKIGSKSYAVNVVKGEGNKKVSGLKVGTYKATAKLAATNAFKASTKTVTFKVKAHKIKLKLKKVKVRRSAKKLVLKATLKIDGKPAKAKKLKFKFKSKKYTAKTNNKGIAKVKVKKSVLKKLKVGKKVKYKVKYGKKTVKRTVKVKR